MELPLLYMCAAPYLAKDRAYRYRTTHPVRALRNSIGSEYLDQDQLYAWDGKSTVQKGNGPVIHSGYSIEYRLHESRVHCNYISPFALFNSLSFFFRPSIKPAESQPVGGHGRHCRRAKMARACACTQHSIHP